MPRCFQNLWKLELNTFVSKTYGNFLYPRQESTAFICLLHPVRLRTRFSPIRRSTTRVLIDMFHGILFQESLQDLVKGIRANRRNEDEYMRRRLGDIGDECRTSDMEKKAVAVLKLTYLQMMGHSIGFSSFYITEVMSSPIFATKRIGYLAAAQSFSPTTDVLLLTTNQFKKDLTNGKVQDCSQALTCLGKLITEELGRDLEHDIVTLLSSPRPYIRKKALLVLYRLILVHPETLSVVSTKLREMLGDSNPSVVCAAVTVICELAKANPHNFLSLAPVFYQLLTSPASNNWMLIKIVKLMGVLTPQEPRLARKLVEPLVSLMRSTRAKSLLYECCCTITSGLLAHPEAVELCAEHLGKFMVDSDQNLKYLGLLSMRKLIKVHPDVAMEHRDLVIDCLGDDDVGIRMRALEIVSEFLTRRNFKDLCRILLRKLRKASDDATNIIKTPSVDNGPRTEQPESAEDFSQPEYDFVIDEEAPYRDALAEQLLRPGEYVRGTDDEPGGGYMMLNTTDDFQWYFVTVLNGLATTEHLSARVNAMVAEQMMELTSRVLAIREIAVKVALGLFESNNSLWNSENAEEPSDIQTNGNVEEEQVENSEEIPEKEEQRRILPLPLVTSASWIVGEYAELVSDHVSALKILSNYDMSSSASSQVSFLSAVLKIFSLCPEESIPEAFAAAREYIDSRVASESAEVQDRAWLFSNLLGEIAGRDKVEFQLLFEGKLKPVDTRAQSVIPVPEGLNLDKPLIETNGEPLSKYLMRKVPSLPSDRGQDFDVGGVEKENDRSRSKRSEDKSRIVDSPFLLGHDTRRDEDRSSSIGNAEKLSNSFSNDAPSTGKTAVLVPDEVPEGVDMSKVNPNARSAGKSSRDVNLLGSFSATDKPKLKRKLKGKKKKKKKKNSAESGALSKDTGTSLIDLGETTTKETPVSVSTTPRHLAEEADLLL